MTLSSGKLNDIANLYESIVASEQEQLNEGAADVGAGIRKAVGGAVGGAVRNASDIGGSALRGLVGQKTTSSNPISKLANTYTRVQSAPLRAAGDFTKGLVTGQGDSKPKAGPALPDRLKNAAPAPSLKSKQDYAASKGKYFSSSDNKTYANYGAAKAAHDARVGAGAPPKPPAGVPGAGLAKTPPAAAKPAIPTGTTAGGTTFQRRAATGAELRAAQAARAAGKGEEGAIKAGVAASKPAATPAATPARNGFGASTAQMAAQSSVRSATAPGSEVAATNKAAANPSSGTTPLRPASAPPTPTERTGGAPLRKEPLWNSYQYDDAYDVVLEYLLDTGHAESVAEAQYIMTELDEETIAEIYKGRHGQSETEHQDSRSHAGKMISGDSKRSGAAWTSRGVKNTGPNPAGGSQRPQAQGRMTTGQRDEMRYRQANLKKKD